MSTQPVHFKAYHLKVVPETISGRFSKLSEILDRSLQDTTAWSKSMRANLVHWQNEIEAGRLLCPAPWAKEGDASPFDQSIIAEFLETIREDTDDWDWLTFWESLNALKQSVEGMHFQMYIDNERSSIANDVAEEMCSLFPTEESLPFTKNEMQGVVELFFKDWLAAAKDAPLIEQQVAFIRLFFRHLVQSYSMPLDFWQILLARMRLYANKGMRTGRASTWEDAISSLEDCPSVLISANAYYKAVAENPAELDSPWVDWIPALAVIRGSQQAMRSHFLGSLTLDFFPTAEDELLKTGAGWMSVLRDSMERSALDPLDEQRRWLQLTRGQVEQTESALEKCAGSIAKTAEDLAQGMKGSQAVGEIRQILLFLTQRALWIVMNEPTVSWARKSFVYEMVVVGGVDAKSEIWKKLSQIIASSQNLIRDSTNFHGANEAVLLLDALRKRGEEMRNFDLSIIHGLVQNNARINAMPGERCQRDTLLTLSRLLVESRLKGMSAAVAATIRWYGSEVSPYIAEASPAELADCLEHLADAAAKEEDFPFSAVQLLRGFSAEFPRLTAAHGLLRNAESIALSTAEYVFERLPDYSEKVGKGGRASCARDNQLTLERTAQLVLSGAEDPGEALLEWWSSVVGAYLANRPEGLFENNLQGIYNGIQAHLPNQEVAMAFEPIAHVYRETIGVECMDAKASLPLSHDGTLWKAAIGKRLSPYSELYDWDESFYADFFEDIAASIFPDSKENPSSGLTSLLRRFLQNMALHGDAEAAAKPLYSRLIERIEALGAESVARFYKSLAQHLLRSDSLQCIAIFEAVHVLNEQIGHLGLALKMRNRVRDIATAFPDALRTVAPNFFPEGDAATIHAKCVRDQTLLIDRLSQLALNELPTTYWLSAPRYCMEILLPHIDYPAEVWKVAFRNAAAILAPDLDYYETRALAQWLAQWEEYANGFAGSAALCRKFFRLGDYTFSADEEEEERMRGFLAVALTAAMTGMNAPVQGESIMRRYLLSLNLPVERVTEDCEATVEKLRRIIGKDRPPALDAALDEFLQFSHQACRILSAPEELSPQYASHCLLRTPRFHEALWMSIAVASYSSPEMYALCERECARLEEDAQQAPKLEKIHLAYTTWEHCQGMIVESKPSVHERALLNETIISHLVFPLDGENRSVDTPFSDELVIRLGEALFAHPITNYAAFMRQHLPGLVAQSEEPNRLRSNLRRAIALLPKVEAGISLWQDKTAYNQSEEDSQKSTAEAMPYAALQPLLAHWILAPSIQPPVFGNGFYRSQFETAEFAQTGDHYCLFLSSLLKKSKERHQLPIMESFLATQNGITPDRGASWKVLLRQNKVTVPAFVGEFFQSLHSIAKAAAAYACAKDESARETLQELLLYHLDTLVCTMRETGDIECSIERLKAQLVDDLEVVPEDSIVSGYYGILRHLPDHLTAEEVPVWYQLFEEALQAVREVSLGKAIAKHAESGAEKITAKLNESFDSGVSSERYAKCMRDQTLLVHALAYAWQTHSCNRHALQVGRFLLQTTLPHLSHETPVLGNVFTLYESVFGGSLSAQQKQALWLWTGRWQKIILKLAPLAKFYATARQAIPKAADPFVCLQAEDDFLAGLIVAAATPRDGMLHSDAVLGRQLLGSDILSSPHRGQALALSRNLPLWKNQGIALPLRFREVVESWQGLLALATDLKSLAGAHIVRTAGVYGQSSLGLVLWRNSVLARSSNGQNHTDQADLRIAEALRLDIPEPTVVKKLQQQLHWLKHSWGGLAIPESVAPKKGLFQKLVSREVKEVPVNREVLKREARFIAYALSVYEVLERDPRQFLSEFFFCPQTRDKITIDSATGTFRFYRDLVEALVEAVGETHPLTRLMRTFQLSLEDAYRAHRLLEGELCSGDEGRFLALYQWDWKDLDSATAYSHDGSDDPLLIVNQMQKRFLKNLPAATNEHDRKALQDSWSRIVSKRVAIK